MKFFKRTLIVAAAAVLIGIAYSFIFPEKVYKSIIHSGRLAAGLEQKELAVDDHKIVYLESGSGEETVVLVHGFGADKDNWPRMARFMPGYRFIIPDLPGFGESTKIESAKYDADSQAERLDRFFVTLGLERFYIAGNSMGGNISGVYAGKYPKKVKGLILLNNSGVNAPEKSAYFKCLEKGNNPLLVNNREDYKNMIKFVFEEEPFIPYPVLTYLAERGKKSREFNNKVFGEITSSPAMLEKYFSVLAMPVLIIWGDKDKVLDVSSVGVLEKGIKNHSSKILKDCGHLPMMERPEETAGYIRSFVESNRR